MFLNERSYATAKPILQPIIRSTCKAYMKGHQLNTYLFMLLVSNLKFSGTPILKFLPYPAFPKQYNPYASFHIPRLKDRSISTRFPWLIPHYLQAHEIVPTFLFTVAISHLAIFLVFSLKFVFHYIWFVYIIDKSYSSVYSLIPS
jgi:hypothetical protein